MVSERRSHQHPRPPLASEAAAAADAREIVDQNRELKLKLRQSEIELVKMRALVEEFSRSGDGLSIPFQGKQACDAVKKNRNLTLALEREKTKAKRLEQELGALKAELAAAQADADAPASAAGERQAQRELQAASASAKEWKDKAAVAMQKLGDMQIQAEKYKAENAKLALVLRREVGDNISLASLLEDRGGGGGGGGLGGEWKGRAEQLILLREKVKELGCGAKGPRKTRAQDKHEQALGCLAAERRKEVDDLQQELQAARAQLKAAKSKAEASSARAQVLGKELKSLKEKLSAVLEKTHNDDKLIEALQGELGRAVSSERWRGRGGGRVAAAAAVARRARSSQRDDSEPTCEDGDGSDDDQGAADADDDDDYDDADDDAADAELQRELEKKTSRIRACEKVIADQEAELSAAAKLVQGQRELELMVAQLSASLRDAEAQLAQGYGGGEESDRKRDCVCES